MLNHQYFTHTKKDSRIELKEMLMKRIPSFKNMTTIETSPSCTLDERTKYQVDDKENQNNCNRADNNFRKPRKSESPCSHLQQIEKSRGSHRSQIPTTELTK